MVEKRHSTWCLHNLVNQDKPGENDHMLQLGNLASVTVTLPSGNRGTGMLLDFVNIAFSKQSWGGGAEYYLNMGVLLEKIRYLLLNLSEPFFDTSVGPRPNFARMCG